MKLPYCPTLVHMQLNLTQGVVARPFQCQSTDPGMKALNILFG